MSAFNLDSKLQTQEIYLDSQYASVNSSSTNSDLYFFLQTPILVGNDHDIVLRVENFVCPISFFVVNSTNNRLVTSTGTYVIPEGNYNALTLKSQLETIMPSYSIGYDVNTNKLSFTSMTDFTFLSTSTCFKIIGFEEGINHSSAGSTLTSEYVVNLSGTSLIYIDIPNITTRNISSKNGGGFTTIIKSVVADVPYGSILSYTNNTTAAVKLQEKYISYFHVRLLDDDYNLLDLNGQHFSLTLELFYYSNGNPAGFTGNLTDVIREQEKIKSSLVNET